MPKINFKDVDDIDDRNSNDFEPVPSGVYLCNVLSVNESKTKNGDDMWRLKFAVEDGPHAGRYIWDNLVFSSLALPRVKMALDAFGLDTVGEVDLTPDAILGRSCFLTIRIESFENKARNTVAFKGYGAAAE